MVQENIPQCVHCGSALKLSIAYNRQRVKSENVETDYKFSLCCPKMSCGIIYPLERIKNHNDFSENLEEHRAYKTNVSE